MYEYANARIRGLRSRLLRPQDLAALAAQADIGDLVAALARTDYGVDLERARLHWSGVALIEEALRRNLSRRLRGLLDFFEAERSSAGLRGRRLVGILLARYDLRNLVAVLRGKAAGATTEEIQAALLPAGALTDEGLARLAAASDLDACVAQMLRLDLPYTHSLSAARTAREGGPRGGGSTMQWLPSLELALRRDFLDWAATVLRGGGADAALVRATLALETDATNLLVVLRLVHRGTRPEPQVVASLLLPGGALRVEALLALLAHRSVGEAIAALGHTPLRRALTASGALQAALDERVTLEWVVERYLASWARAQLYRDPLGIALALDYQAAKVEETRAVRLIARGLAAGWPRERARDLLGLNAA